MVGIGVDVALVSACHVSMSMPDKKCIRVHVFVMHMHNEAP